MASPRKSSTEIISDALKYEKLANNQKDTVQDKQHTILQIESRIQIIAIELKSLLGELSTLLNDIQTKQTAITSAKKDKCKLAVKTLVAELQDLESEKTDLAQKVQELKLQIIEAQEKIRTLVKAPTPSKKPTESQANITFSLGVVELIIQRDQEKLRDKRQPKKSPAHPDEDLPVDGIQPQTKKPTRCTIQ